LRKSTVFRRKSFAVSENSQQHQKQVDKIKIEGQGSHYGAFSDDAGTDIGRLREETEALQQQLDQVIKRLEQAGGE
jgi:hypothetical protein